METASKTWNTERMLLFFPFIVRLPVLYEPGER